MQSVGVKRVETGWPAQEEGVWLSQGMAIHGDPLNW